MMIKPQNTNTEFELGGINHVALVCAEMARTVDFYSGVILSAAYALWLYRRVALGDLIKGSLMSMREMSPRERWIFVPLIAMTLLLGVYPRAVTDITRPAVAALLQDYHASQPAPAPVAVVATAGH